jgi:hypothetical protein
MNLKKISMNTTRSLVRLRLLPPLPQRSEIFDFLHKKFWGRRDRIKEHIKIHLFPADRTIDEFSAVFNPYDLVCALSN